MRRRLFQALLAVGHGPDLTGQTHLAERDGLLRQRPITQARQHGHQYRHIRRRLLHADATHDIDEDVLIVRGDAAMPM